MRRMLFVPALVVVALGLTSAALAGGPCCDKAKAENAWCSKCKVGFFDGVTIKSEKLHQTLAGTPVKPDEIKCLGCKKAASEGGECSQCHVGFARDACYKSLVAYRIARGEPVDLKKMGCKDCEKAAADHGWCGSCGMGLVGIFAFTDKADYEGAVKARAILVKAAEGKCDGCAIAMVTDGNCDHCHVAYKNGEMVKPAVATP